MWRVKVKSISFYIILLLFNLGWTFMYCTWILLFLPVWHVIWFLVFSSYDIILNFVVFFENVFHVVPVEDPTLREMAEYMEVNRYAQKWRTFFVAQDYSRSSNYPDIFSSPSFAININVSWSRSWGIFILKLQH